MIDMSATQSVLIPSLSGLDFNMSIIIEHSVHDTEEAALAKAREYFQIYPTAKIDSGVYSWKITGRGGTSGITSDPDKWYAIARSQ